MNLEVMDFTSKLASKAMEFRQDCMVFCDAKLIQDGGVNIDDHLDMIRDAILGTESLINIEAQKDFRFLVSNCMSRTILDQIGGTMNSFNEKSFRLN